MGKIAIIGFGILLILFAGYGVSNNLRDKALLETWGDQETKGKVLFVTKSQGGDGATKYGFRYTFRTPDGKVHAGKYGRSETALQYLKNGEAVTVRYMSDDPRKSTAFTASNPPKVIRAPDEKLKICYGIGAFGLLVIVLGLFSRPEQKPSAEQPGPQKFSDDPVAALRKWRSEWELGPAAYC